MASRWPDAGVEPTAVGWSDAVATAVGLTPHTVVLLNLYVVFCEETTQSLEWEPADILAHQSLCIGTP